MTPSTLIWLILLIPLVGFVTPILLGKQKTMTIGWLSAGFTTLNLAFGLLLLMQFRATSQTAIQLNFDWFIIANKPYRFGFLVDSLTLLMLLLINFVALLVQLFSMEYLHDEPDKHRYFGFLSLFVFSMLGIVLTNNLFVLYAFWELVGLSSYLLIGFWYQKPEAVQASKKAFLMNRIGDVGFLLGIFLVYYLYKSTDFEVLGSHTMAQQSLVSVAGLLLFCGCIGKSAQFPLHTWLPDAMEGPTPVSALIHAATMVVAGIYLLARIQPLITDDISLIIAGIGCITMLLGSIYAIFQTDIKKTLAYSTVSQLGLMVIGLGTDASVFHLLTHAFFKAGLFLSAGSVIHALHHAGHDFDAQDMRLMGGLKKQMPFTFICYLVCSMALAGLPLFSGFLSKDAILEQLIDAPIYHSSIVRTLIIMGVLIGIILTAFYMTRQVWRVFFGSFRNSTIAVHAVHEGSWKIKLPIGIFAILSFGLIFSLNPVVGQHSWFWGFINPTIIKEHTENHWIGLLSTAMVGIGISLGYFMRNKEFTWTIPTFDGFYTNVFINPILKFSAYLQTFDQFVVDGLVNLMANLQVIMATMVAWIDRNIVDGLANGAGRITGTLGQVTRSVQGGKSQLYVTMAFLGLISLLILIILL